MSAASEKALKELHGKLATKMTQLLDDGEVTAATLNAIRSFLSDNDITCDVETDDQMKRLRDKLQERKNNLKKKQLTDEERSEVTNVVQFHGVDREAK